MILQSAANTHANAMVDAWWGLAWKLIGKYSNNYQLNGEGQRTPQDWEELGYPDWWIAPPPPLMGPPHTKTKICTVHHCMSIDANEP